MIEITSAGIISSHEVEIEAVDVSEVNLQHFERNRDDGGFERKVIYRFDIHQTKAFQYLDRWLHRQKAVLKANPATYGEALKAVVGTIVQPLSSRYRVWEL